MCKKATQYLMFEDCGISFCPSSSNYRVDLMRIDMAKVGMSSTKISLVNDEWGKDEVPAPYHFNNPIFIQPSISGGSGSLGSISQSQISNQLHTKEDKSKHYFIELITERIYKINNSDYNKFLNAIRNGNKSGEFIELAERVIDYHSIKAEGEGKAVYTYKNVIRRFIPFDKVLSLFVEDKKK